MNHAEKVPLTITRVNVSEDGTLSIDRGNSFTAMLNPSEFSHTRAIRYNTKATLGQVGADTKFAAVNPDTVTISLLLDGTGAVPPPPGKTTVDVEDQVKQLNAIVYKYVGDRHEPSHVRILWGTLILYARLSTMSLQYTLFKPSGDPLRAKATLGFLGFMSTKEAEAEARRSSPDLTHVLVVRAGDTLPSLCNQIYGDPAYYPDVARANGLSAFRRLPPGLQLRFPPVG